jgi:hypothetical protein
LSMERSKADFLQEIFFEWSGANGWFYILAELEKLVFYEMWKPKDIYVFLSVGRAGSDSCPQRII